MAKSRIQKYSKQRKKNNLIMLGIGLVVGVLLIGGLIIFTQQARLNQSDQNTSIKNVNALSMKEVSTLVIVYSHQQFPNNKDWNAIYESANSNGLRVKKYKVFQFDDYEARAVKNHPLFVMKQRAIFAMSTTKPQSSSQITIGDSHKQLVTKSLSEIYKSVLKNKQTKQKYIMMLDNVSVDKNVSVSVVDK